MSRISRSISDYLQGNCTYIAVVTVMFSAGLAVSALPELTGRWDRWIAAAVLVGLTLFLLRGAVKTVDRLSDEGTGPQMGWVVYAAAGMFLLFVSARVLTLALPATNVVPPDDSKPPKVMLEDGAIRIIEEIDYRTLTELRPFLASEESNTPIVIESPGGLVIAGRSIGLAIEKAGFHTHVEGTCASACVLVFAGGQKRSLGPDGKLGFHSYRFDSGYRTQTVAVSDEIEKSRLFLLKRGFAPDFVDRVYKVPPEDIWFPQRSVLSEAGVITSP